MPNSLKDIVERIEMRLRELDLTAAQASRMAGLGVDGIRNLQRSLRKGKETGGANLRTIQQLAPVLKTSVIWLLEGRTEEEPPPAAPGSVPVVGYVGAGALIYEFPDEPGELDRVLAPANATDTTVAVRIEGDSLGSFYNGWYAFYNAGDMQHPPTEDLIGKLCVCWTGNGGVMIKRLQRGTLAGRWKLEALFEPPIHDVVVTAAAMVIDMGPRQPL